MAAVFTVAHVWMRDPPAPITPAGVQAVLTEARARLAARTPSTVAWRTLDARSLRALLNTELLRTAPLELRLLLIDQAAAWDELHFSNPSDILAQWQRLDLANGLEFEDQPMLRLERTWVATSDWSDEAAAALALWQCLPAYSWGHNRIPPLYYAFRSGSAWFASQSAAPDFGGCVRKLRVRAPYTEMPSLEPRSSYPDTALGRRAADVLLRKLPRFIRRNGCQGTGADDCVLLLEALESLGADRATLEPVLARMDGSFAPPTNMAAMLADPAGAPDAPTPPGNAVPAGASQETFERLVQIWIYLDARVQALAAAAPDVRLPEGEPAATIDRLFAVTVALHHTGQPGGTRLANPDEFTNPWSRVSKLASARPEWAAALLARGEVAAAAPGCGPLANVALSPNDAVTPPQEFWLGFATRKLESVGTACNRLPGEALLRHVAAGPSEPILSRLTRLVGHEEHARAHVEILDALGPACTPKADALAICPWLRDAPRAASNEGLKVLPLKPGQAWTPVSDDKLPPYEELAGRLALLRPEWGAATQRTLAALPGHAEWRVAGQWLSPNGAAAAVWIANFASVPDERSVGALHAPTLLMLMDAHGARLVNLPADMEGEHRTLSDIDGDGNLELWSEADEGECDGEDLKPGIDCAVHRARLVGEVFGTEIAPYLQGPWPAPPMGAAGSKPR